MNTHKLLILLLSSLLFKSVFGGNIQEENLKVFTSGLSFEENIGQVENTEVKYIIKDGLSSIYVTKTGLLFSNSNAEFSESDLKRTSTVFSGGFNFLNSNTEVIIQPTDEIVGYKTNFYLPNCPNGVFGAKHYTKLVFKNLYDNIDLILEIKSNKLKYSFDCKAGSDFREIKLQWGEGIETVFDGQNLEASLGSFKISESQFNSFIEGKKVEMGIVLLNNTVTYHLNLPTPLEKNLLIDPVVTWSTYVGASSGTTGLNDGNDQFKGVSVDSKGNIYAIGYATSYTSISTTGTFQTSHSTNGLDGFMMKFDSSGKRIWGTYYGGNSEDFFWHNPSFDGKEKNFFVCGQTYSTNVLASSGAFQSTMKGNFDGFIAKFDTSGKRVWGTFFGGNGGDRFQGIKCNKTNAIYLTGMIGSSGFATSGAFQTSLGSSRNIIIAKFDTSGSRIWSTYYGGNGVDYGYAVALDSLENLYITGECTSNGLATSGAYLASTSGSKSAFLTKFNKNGARQWFTYITSNGIEYSEDITIKNSLIYLVGVTNGNLNTTANTHQTTRAGGSDLFLSSFDLSGAHRWTTLFGGSGDEFAGGIDFDKFGKIYISGGTTSTTGISTSDGFQKSLAGGNDLFFAKFNDKGTLEYSTYYGGSQNEIDQTPLNSKVAYNNKSNSVILAAYTKGSTGLSTSNAYQTTYGGGFADGLLVSFGTQNIINKIITKINSVCNTTSVYTFETSNNLGKKYDWECINCTIVGTVDNKADVKFDKSGDSAIVKVKVSYGINSIADEDEVVVFLSDFKIFPKLRDTFICEGSSISIGFNNSLNDYNYSWTSQPAGFNSIQKNPIVNPTATTVYFVQIENKTSGCTYKDTINVTIYNRPTLAKLSDYTICEGDFVSIGVTNNSNYSYKWSTKNDGIVGTTSNLIVSPITNSTYYLEVSDNSGNCSVRDSSKITVFSKPTFQKLNDLSVCSGETVSVGLSNAPSNFNYTWSSSPIGFVSNLANPNLTPTSDITLYLQIEDKVSKCKTFDTVVVYVGKTPIAFAGENTKICEGDIISIGESLSDTSTFKYEWTTVSGNFTDNKPLINVSPELDNVYVLKVTNKLFDCFSIDSVKVSVVNSNNGFGYTINKNEVELVINNPVDNSKYTWYLGNGDSIKSTNNVLRYTYLKNGLYNVRLKTEIDGCVFSFIDSFSIVSNSINLYEKTSNFIKVYPNPIISSNKSEIFVESVDNKAISSVYIYGANGKLLYQNNNVNSNKTLIQLPKSIFSQGVYLFKINSGDDYIIEKVIMK